MYGSSYMGLTQWAAAVARPPSLVTVQPAFTTPDPYSGWLYAGGGFQLHFHMAWVHFLGADLAARRRIEAAPTAEFSRLFTAQNLALLDGDAHGAARYEEEAEKFVLTEASRLPLDGYADFAAIAPFYREWLAHASPCRRSRSPAGTTSSSAASSKPISACARRVPQPTANAS